jgi:hypothetical protein
VCVCECMRVSLDVYVCTACMCVYVCVVFSLYCVMCV